MVGIYKITNKENCKVYIGQTNNFARRYKEHFLWKLNKRQYIDEIISDFGTDNFTFEIIEECPSEKLDEREKYWIQFYNSFYDGYNKTKGGAGNFYGNPKLSKEDVERIRTAYNNKEDRKKIYSLYQDKITFSGFCHVWDGSRWTEIMPEVYTEENKTFHKNKTKFLPGGKHPSAKLSDEEVIKIRTRYIKETAREIWEDYKDKYSLGSLKQVLTGAKYSHIPIYKKNERRWINDESKTNS